MDGVFYNSGPATERAVSGELVRWPCSWPFQRCLDSGFHHCHWAAVVWQILRCPGVSTSMDQHCKFILHSLRGIKPVKVGI